MATRIAVDLGSSGLLALEGRLSGGQLDVQSLGRFDRPTRWSENGFVWDREQVTDHIGRALSRACRDGDSIESMAIDTPANDVGLVRNGAVVQDPYFYQDPALRELTAEITETISRRELFELTGSRRTPNAYVRLCGDSPSLTPPTDTVVPLPQLLSVCIGGQPRTEPTMASTTGLFNVHDGTWAERVLEALDLPAGPLAPIGSVGEQLGTVSLPGNSLGRSDIDIIMLPGHDTASAVAALPLTGSNGVFLCTGSWLVPGIELAAPVTSEAAFRAGATNEAGVDGTVRFVRNLPGFALLEDCREEWRESGQSHAYEELLERAESRQVTALIDPAHPLMYKGLMEGDVREKVATLCRHTDQPVPDDPGAVTSCLVRSLAVRGAVALDQLTDCAGVEFDRIHLCGGGMRNQLFCRTLATAAGRLVISGPTEATGYGNLLLQFRSAGVIDSLSTARSVVDRSVSFDRYRPCESLELDDAMSHMRSVMASLDEGSQ
jgi:rhamnulokinase